MHQAIPTTERKDENIPVNWARTSNQMFDGANYGDVIEGIVVEGTLNTDIFNFSANRD